MKTIKTQLEGKITVDAELDERYNDGPLFPHKIDRVRNLLKDTKLDPAVAKVKKTA